MISNYTRSKMILIHNCSNQKQPDFYQKSPWNPISQLSPVCLGHSFQDQNERTILSLLLELKPLKPSLLHPAMVVQVTKWATISFHLRYLAHTSHSIFLIITSHELYTPHYYSGSLALCRVRDSSCAKCYSGFEVYS